MSSIDGNATSIPPDPGLQLAPEIYGVAASQMFAYAPMDYNAPYLMPQTLNILTFIPVAM